MALVNPYCTVAAVREELKNTDTADVTDATIQDFINSASRWIDQYTDRTFYEIADYSGADLTIRAKEDFIFKEIVYLPFFPIITLTLVKVGTETYTVDEDYEILYRMNPGNGKMEGTRLRRLGDLLWAVGSPDDRLVLRGTFGYDQSGTPANVPTDLPDFITRSCILIAAAFSGHNTKQVQGFDGSATQINDRSIPKEVYRMLGKRGKFLC